MNKGATATITALLVAIAIEGAVTASAVRRIAREGFNIELTTEEADSLAAAVDSARVNALEDMME